MRVLEDKLTYLIDQVSLRFCDSPLGSQTYVLVLSPRYDTPLVPPLYVRKRERRITTKRGNHSHVPDFKTLFLTGRSISDPFP